MARYASLILGAVFVVGAAFGLAFLWGPAIALLAGGAASLLLQGNDNANRAKAQELQINGAIEGVPYPVVFGQRRITANYLRADRSQLIAVEQTEDAGGSGGGGSISTGYKYYLTFELGICMGPIDAIGQIYAAPGELSLRETAPQATETNRFGIALSVLFYDGTAGQTKLITLPTDAYTNLEVGDSFAVANISDWQILDKLGSNQVNAVGLGRRRTECSYLHNYRVLPYPPDLGQTGKVVVDSTADIEVGQRVRVGDYYTGVVTAKTATVLTIRADALLGQTATLKRGILPDTPVYAEIAIRTEITEDGFGDSSTDFMLTSDSMSGTCRIYKGSDTQRRTQAGDPHYADGMNYPYVCWAEFLNFYVGPFPNPKSFGFEIYRLPRCQRDDGTTVTSIKTRGSNDANNPRYHQANPAAIVWECIQNKWWGRGISHNFLNEASFAECSEFFAERNIAMNLILETAESLPAVLEAILAHVKGILLFDGEQIKLKTMLDTEAVHASIQTLNASVVYDLTFQRPTWDSTLNELRIEFTSSARNYRGDSVIVPSVANFQTVGIINQQRMSLAGFTDADLVRQHGMRLMSELSYPPSGVKFKMNRFKSQIEPGDCIRLVWDEWAEGKITGYYIVIAVKPLRDDEAIEVTAVEDLELNAVEGEQLTVTPPDVLPWLLESNAEQAETPSPIQDGEITPLLALEIPPVLTGGEERYIVTGERPNSNVIGITVMVSGNGGASYAQAGNFDHFAITGRLDAAVAAGPYTDRSATGIVFRLRNPAENEATILQANVVPNAGTDLSNLADSGLHYLIIGEEIMQVGLITKLGENSYRATNLIRGCFGTIPDAHALESIVIYSQTLPFNDYLTKDLPEETQVLVRGYPRRTFSQDQVGGDYLFTHEPPHDGLYMGAGSRPLAPEPRSISSAGLNTTIELRPQFHDRGAAVVPFAAAAGQLTTNIDGHGFIVEEYDTNGDLVAGPVAVPHTFTPDALDDPDAGVVTLDTFARQATTTTVKVFTERNGRRSLRAAQFNV